MRTLAKGTQLNNGKHPAAIFHYYCITISYPFCLLSTLQFIINLTINNTVVSTLDIFFSSYVSRKHPSDNKSHEILGVQQVKPAELAQQMTLDIGNAWGVLHAIVDTCLEQPPGKYLIMKDPNQVHEFLMCRMLSFLRSISR